MCRGLEATPLAHGGARTTWTLRVVLTLLLPLVAFSLSGLWRLLRRLKRHLKRVAQRQRSPDPDYLALRERLLAARQRAARAPEHWIHLDLDEASLHRHPSLARTYAPQGSQPPQAGGGIEDATRTIFGAVDTWSGRTHFKSAPSGAATHFLVFLKELLDAYPERRLSVALDNWSVHTSEAAQAFYQKHAARLEIIWLPTYSPWLMAQEKIWKWMRSYVTHQHPFATIAEVMVHFWNWAGDLKHNTSEVIQRIHKFVPVLDCAQ